MYPRDTIAAIATAPGAGGIAIIRVSGDDARAVASRVFRGFPDDDAVESHRLYAGTIVDRDGARIDRGLAVEMASPRSYTGEDVVELHCHGGAVVARAVLAAVLAAGARAARAGEFTLRAFLNGKLDLARAEAVADLIGARTEAAARVAGDQLDGAISEVVARRREVLIGVAARLEAAIDFADEDDVSFDPSSITLALRAEIAALRPLAESFQAGRLLRDGARVVFAGRPNAGKSSLINRLLGSDRIIVTPIPGTTRDTIEETCDIGGIPVLLVDTAGLRTPTETVERFGIERSLAEIRRADLVVWVVDGNAEGEDGEIADATRQSRMLIALNKSDLPTHGADAIARASCPQTRIVASSAIEPGGIDELRTAIAGALRCSAAEGAIVVTRERHHGALERAAASLEVALVASESRQPPELIAVDVAAALNQLGEIVGLTTSEDVLDRIFREFCIGK